MMDAPWTETERRLSMPSTVLTTSSIGCETSVSISSGDAPGKVVRTVTVGKSTAGNRSTPSLKKAAAPTTASDKTIIAAKTGRRIQTSANFCIYELLGDNGLSGLEVTWIDNNAVPEIGRASCRER